MSTVAVVIPVRDNAPTVSATIESVLGQDPPPTDVIVVCAPSADTTRSIVASYPVRILDQVGTGLGRARNQGIAASNADLLAFCDGDDTWTGRSLAARIDHLASHPGCAAVAGHYVTPGDEKARPALTPGGLVIRRHVPAVVGPFREDLTIGADSDWLVRLRESGCRFDMIADVVLCKTRRAGSLSTDVIGYRHELLRVARDFVDRHKQR